MSRFIEPPCALLRNDEIVKRQFFRFLIPSVVSTIALSLNEFADSIIVAQLLGSPAMSVVNLGMPIMLVYAIVYTMFGIGGSVLYANYLGKMERKKAGEIFSFTLFASLAVAAVITLVGLLFYEEISRIFCTDESLLSMFIPYTRVLSISASLVILIQVLINFLPATGNPKLATFINVLANVVNLIFDYIFIHFFDMGITGAAWATFVGYAVGLAFLIAWVLLGKCRISFALFSKETVRMLSQIVAGGMSSAMTQLGFAVKFSYCNFMAGSLAGIAGITAFAGCIQTISLVSIFMAGIAISIIPLIAVMRAQKDYVGIRFLCKRALKSQLAVNMIFTLLFLFFPSIITSMYNIESADAYSMTIKAVRIFSVMFVIRGFVQVAQYNHMALGRKKYAFIISAFDGFVGIVPLVYLLSRCWGVDGLWLAYPLCSLLIVVGIFAYNFVAQRRLSHKMSPFLFVPSEKFKNDVLDISIHGNMEKAGVVTRMVLDFCDEYGIDSQKANLLAVATEEIFVYTACNSKDKYVNMDMRITIENESIVVYTRSIGLPFDHFSADQEKFGNIWMIKKIASEVKYDYLLGVNQTRFKLAM